MFYIFEVQRRPDGVSNVCAIVSRSSHSLALSYYYERKSKMIVNEAFESVSLMCTDSDLGVIEQCIMTKE